MAVQIDKTNAYLKQNIQDFEQRWSKPIQNNAHFSDFVIKKKLGAGAFGRVCLVYHKGTKTHYAMKILDKKQIVKMKQIDHVLYEKKILQAINFPFLVKLHFSFKDTTNLYLVLEMLIGGDLFTYHRKVRRFGEPQAKLYGAQVVLAFEYLHALDILYRDLKPENIMIAGDGYLKVIDLGFAKRVPTRTYTMCGTPDYIAPEIIQNKGYGKAVDWWTFGILLFEMAAGVPPFEASEHMSIYQNIISGKYKAPSFFSQNLKDLLRHLITADLSRRYGNLKQGVRDIKNHPWFAEIGWMQVYEKKYVPPYQPKASAPDDTSAFGHTEDMKIDISPVDMYTKEFEEF